MDTFPIVRRRDEERYGEYRTKRVILEVYDAMQTAAASRRPVPTPSSIHPPPIRSVVIDIVNATIEKKLKTRNDVLPTRNRSKHRGRKS